MSPSSSKSKTYVLLKKPTLLKGKSLSKQGKEIRTSRSPSEWAAKHAMSVYTKKHKQIGSLFLYRKGTVYRYSVSFKSKAGKKCASARLTSRSVCSVTPGRVGKSRACRPHGSSSRSISAQKKSLSKSKSELKKVSISVSASRKRVKKAKKTLCKSKTGTKKRAAAKKKLTKATKALSMKEKMYKRLKALVRKKSKTLSRSR